MALTRDEFTEDDTPSLWGESLPTNKILNKRQVPTLLGVWGERGGGSERRGFLTCLDLDLAPSSTPLRLRLAANRRRRVPRCGHCPQLSSFGITLEPILEHAVFLHLLPSFGFGCEGERFRYEMKWQPNRGHRCIGAVLVPSSLNRRHGSTWWNSRT